MLLDEMPLDDQCDFSVETLPQKTRKRKDDVKDQDAFFWESEKHKKPKNLDRHPHLAIKIYVAQTEEYYRITFRQPYTIERLIVEAKRITGLEDIPSKIL